MGDNLFHLGWLEEDPNSALATNCLKILADKSSLYAKKGVYEEDTKAIFVEPLLRGLGWDTLDHEQVDRERPGCRDPDIELWRGADPSTNKLAALIEVKPVDWEERALWPGQPSCGESAYEQLRRYALARLGPDHKQHLGWGPDGQPMIRGAATNGACWLFWNFGPDVERLAVEDHKPFYVFRFGDSDLGDLIKALARSQLLSTLGLS